ncbi:COG1470 family protein [Georgenia wangjunii]|uniref:COG1470 family protein n=1 Tax=Georgenia wangjunii TaxID=3117730 RepID=UPI002F2693A9
MSFCPSCHNYLGWADTQSIARVEEEPVRTGAPGVATPARTPVRPAGAGPVGDRPQPTGAVAAVGLALSVSRLEVDPGATATVTATVRNHGSLVDEFVVRVEGPASAWATVDPARTAVYPAGETSFTIDFTPPRNARCQVDAFWVAISLPRPGYVFIGDGNVSFPAARPCLGADGGL